MLANASSSRIGTLCGHFANFSFTRFDGAVLEYGDVHVGPGLGGRGRRFGVELGGLALGGGGDGGGEDGVGSLRTKSNLGSAAWGLTWFLVYTIVYTKNRVG